MYRHRLFNAAGWLQVANEAEHLNKVRLLIGADLAPQSIWSHVSPAKFEPELTQGELKEHYHHNLRH